MKKLVIIGAGGHGKVIADIALLNGYEDIVFLDDDEGKKECAGCPVIGPVSDAKSIAADKILAIGDARIRERIQSELPDVVTLVHPNAVIGRRVTIGKGSVVMAGAIINTDTVIGDGVIINTGASLDHDCWIKDFVHISVAAHLAGSCEIGTRTWLGAGAIVINNKKICGDCMIGAGAVVVQNIDQPGTYVGVPARKIK